MEEAQQKTHLKAADGAVSRSPALTLDMLPQEIIETIAHFLRLPFRFASRDRDVAALVRTNRTLCYQLNEYLYRENQRSYRAHARRCGFHADCVKEALMWAIDEQRPSTVRRALSFGVLPRDRPQSLPSVVSMGHLPTIDAYLESGLLRADAVHPEGGTALYWAVSNYKDFKQEGRNLAKELVENHHAPVNHPLMYFAKMPLFKACRMGNLFMIELLVAHGGWVNPPLEALQEMERSYSVPSEDKQRVYDPGFCDVSWDVRDGHDARRDHFRGQGISDIFDDSDTDSEESEDSEFSVASFNPIVFTNPEMANFFNKQESHTPLEVAAEHGQVGACEVLLTLGSSLSSSSVFPGWTPLHAAAHAARPDVVALLLKHGAPTDRPGETYSALDAAISAPDKGRIPDCVRLLLEAGAAPGPSPYVSRTLTAARRGLCKVSVLLYEKGANIRREASLLLEEAVDHGSVNLARVALATGLETKIQWNLNSRPLLSRAIMRWDGYSFEMPELLVRSGAELDRVDAHGNTLLHELAGRTVDMYGPRVEHLASLGADTNIRASATGFTACHTAVERNHLALVQRMARSNLFDMSCKDNVGRTPLFYAALRGYDQSVNLILSRGRTQNRRGCNKADLDWSSYVADASGQVPLIAALSNGHHAVVKTFLMAAPRNLLARDEAGHGVLWWAHANPNMRMRRMVREFARRSKIKLEGDLSDLYCRQCKYRSVSNWPRSLERYHCPVCYEGDHYYICRECKVSGATCLDVVHEWQVA